MAEYIPYYKTPIFKNLEKWSRREAILGAETMVAGLIMVLLDNSLIPGGIALLVTGGGIIARSIQLQRRAFRLGDPPKQRQSVRENRNDWGGDWEDAGDGDFIEENPHILAATVRLLGQLTPPDA